ncbi:MAG: TonB-dependent receptor [Anaerovibrio sp.]|nr:TonB-dependent receptor [Anaerovibrio sp.]
MTAPCLAAADMGEEVVDVYGDKYAGDSVDTVIDMESYRGQAKNVPELLRGVAGIQIQNRASGGGAEDMTLKLRGHDSRRYTVLVDGVPQRNAGVMGGSYFSWDAMPFSAIERIEIIKGAKSLQYGQVNGGVINIITRRKSGGTLKRSYGTYKYKQVAFNYNGTAGAFDFGLNYLYENKGAVLRNADYANRQYGFRLDYHVNKTDTVRVGFQHVRTDRGLVVINSPDRADYNDYYPITNFADAFSNAKTTEVGDGSRTRTYRNSFDISYDSKRTKGSDRFTYWRVNEKIHEIKKSGGTLLFERNNSTDQSQGYIYKGSRILNDKHELYFGADYTRYRYGHGWYDSNAEGASALYPSQKADVYGIYVGDTWLMDNRWSLNYGVRYDSMKGDRDDSRAVAVKSFSDSSLSPKVTATFRNDKATTTSFSVNRIWRAPSMVEFFWYYKGIGMSPLNHNAEGSLRPEKGWGYDLAIEHDFSTKYKSKLSLFYQNYSSFISFVHTKPFNCYMLNGVKIWGFEWENRYNFDDNSSVYFNYTHQHTSKDGAASWDKVALSDQLDYRPRHMISLGYSFEKNGWGINYDVTYTGKQKAVYGYPAALPTEQRAVDMGGYVVHNLSFKKQFNKKTVMNFTIYNLLDKQYCEIYGYPMAKRTYVLTCTRNF